MQFERKRGEVTDLGVNVDLYMHIPYSGYFSRGGFCGFRSLLANHGMFTHELLTQI